MLTKLKKNSFTDKKNNKFKINNNKTFPKLLSKEQFKYLKTTHPYHLVDPSPWPFVGALSAFMITSGLVLFMHRYSGGWQLPIFCTRRTIHHTSANPIPIMAATKTQYTPTKNNCPSPGVKPSHSIG